jgi:hypothetical protein
MDKKTNSTNELKSISLEDDNDKKRFTEKLVKTKPKKYFCLKNLLQYICCYKNINTK